MNEKCDRCGKTMLQADYDAEHATIHIGTVGTDPERGAFFGDAYYLLCPDCLIEWREKLGKGCRKPIGGVSSCRRYVRREESNYSKLFGTPEQAARTLNKLLPDSMHCEYCMFQDYCKDGYCLIGDCDALLEWLSGDAE